MDGGRKEGRKRGRPWAKNSAHIISFDPHSKPLRSHYNHHPHGGGDWGSERLNTSQTLVPDARPPRTVRVRRPLSALPGTAPQPPRPGSCFLLWCYLQ